MDMADERKVCVHLGTSTRIVHFESASASASNDLSEVSKSIKTTFGSVQCKLKMILIGKRSGSILLKIPNKSELKVVDTQVWQL